MSIFRGRMTASHYRSNVNPFAVTSRVLFKRTFSFAPVSQFGLFVNSDILKLKRRRSNAGKKKFTLSELVVIAKRKFALLSLTKTRGQMILADWSLETEHGSRLPVAKKNIFWRAEGLSFATDERMSPVFLAFILMCARPIFGVDKNVLSLVKEGLFKIKCEKMVRPSYQWYEMWFLLL